MTPDQSEDSVATERAHLMLHFMAAAVACPKCGALVERGETHVCSEDK